MWGLNWLKKLSWKKQAEEVSEKRVEGSDTSAPSKVKISLRQRIVTRYPDTIDFLQNKGVAGYYKRKCSEIEEKHRHDLIKRYQYLVDLKQIFKRDLNNCKRYSKKIAATAHIYPHSLAEEFEKEKVLFRYRTKMGEVEQDFSTTLIKFEAKFIKAEKLFAKREKQGIWQQTGIPPIVTEARQFYNQNILNKKLHQHFGEEMYAMK